MSVVLVSTHNLPLAGKLREAFRAVGYRVDLVTPSEDLTDAKEPVLLVVTGTPAETAALLRQAQTLMLPAIVVSAEHELGAAYRGGPIVETFGPAAQPDEVALVGHRLIERRRLQRETGIIGETDAMREALERVVQIAPTQATVLITGESGTGKELVARGLHVLSPRRHKRFIGVNVAALPDTLLESELFGHEKGAFTGAVDSRRGLFELANGGTIFLDEIGEMPLATQTKLLRVLEQREFMRVGGEESIKVDVRIIAATNVDLRQLVAMKEFRRDLYHRLNVLSIHLPALRDRREDIPLLIAEFVREASARNERPFPGITPAAMERLAAYAWPGNVRELRNLVESMVVLAPNRPIEPGDIPPEVRGDASGGALLPAPLAALADARAAVPAAGADPGFRTQLEFIFRTLVDMRVDMDDLRREFEAYREEMGDHVAVRPRPGEIRIPAPGEIAIGGAEGAPVGLGTTAGNGLPLPFLPGGPGDLPADPGVVVYRSGMTMDELERAAILAALREEGGNRRKAAEVLGIGERTLYRKIKQYGLEV
jgi:DNA-binding NtrC family response regulator